MGWMKQVDEEMDTLTQKRKKRKEIKFDKKELKLLYCVILDTEVIKNTALH